MHRRGNHRTNDHDFQIMHAHKLIYEKGYTVGGKAIDTLLSDVCLVPTIVCLYFFLFSTITDLRFIIPECFFLKVRPFWI